MTLLGIFNAKVVNNKDELDELDRVPCMAPKAWSGGRVLGAGCIESNFEEFFGKDS